MTTTTINGISSVPAERRKPTAAANDDAATASPKPAAGIQELDRQGWDPFEVWRIRVKEARSRSSLNPSPATRKS